METGIVAAFAFWGYNTGNGTGMKILLCAVAPLVGFGFWGAVDFHQAGKSAETMRLLQELLISGLAAYALYDAGQELLCWLLAAISILHHVLVYASGQKLLKKEK